LKIRKQPLIVKHKNRLVSSETFNNVNSHSAIFLIIKLHNNERIQAGKAASTKTRMIKRQWRKKCKIFT